MLQAENESSERETNFQDKKLTFSFPSHFFPLFFFPPVRKKADKLKRSM